MEAGLPANTVGATHQSRLIEFMDHCSSLVLPEPYRPQRWRVIHSVAERLGLPWDEAEAAANEVAAEGWLMIEGGHRVCLTQDGRRLKAGES
jgi:hypothetical protein